MNPPPIDPYADKRKLWGRLRVAGGFGFLVLTGAAQGLVTAKHTSTWQEILAVALFILGVFCFVVPVNTANKLQKEHPIEKERTSPLESSQFALAPIDARLQQRNDWEIAKIVLIVVGVIPCGYVLAFQLTVPSPNMRVIEIVCFILAVQFALVLSALHAVWRYPLQLEAIADAEGLHMYWIKVQPKHFAWHEIQEASLVEKLDDTGERFSLSLLIVLVDKRVSPYLIRLSQFKAEDAARFQSVVARYLKPPFAS